MDPLRSPLGQPLSSQGRRVAPDTPSSSEAPKAMWFALVASCEAPYLFLGRRLPFVADQRLDQICTATPAITRAAPTSPPRPSRAAATSG